MLNVRSSILQTCNTTAIGLLLGASNEVRWVSLAETNDGTKTRNPCLQRLVRSSGSFDHRVCSVENVPSAIALDYNEIVARARILFPRKCNTHLNLIFLMHLNIRIRW